MEANPNTDKKTLQFKSTQTRTVELGYYLNSFFFIKWNTNKDIEKLSHLEFSNDRIFVHEYIHFLQDICTTYGLNRIYTIVGWVKKLVHSVLKSTNSLCSIPIKFPIDDVTIDLDDVYEGQQQIDFDFDRISNIEVLENNSIDGHEDEKYVNVELENIEGKKKSFRFGAYCIKESMAHLIESSIFGNGNSPRIPYRIVEDICELYVPGISKKKKMMLSICDFALSFTNPASIMIDLLKILQNKNISQIDEEYLTSIITSFHFIDKLSGKMMSFPEIFLSIHNKAKESISDYYSARDFYKSALEWIEKVMSTAKNLRNFFGLSLFSHIITEDKEKCKKNLANFQIKVGYPILCNKNDIMSLDISAPNEILLLRSVYDIYNLLFDGQVECSLKNNCKQQPNGDITNDFCYSSPWKRAEIKTLCSFGQLWKLWGLAGKKLVANK